MRELAVFYCPKCGHYAYYQTSRHPLCPKCSGNVSMRMLRMYYTEFMKMTCEERDNYLADENAQAESLHFTADLRLT